MMLYPNAEANGLLWTADFPLGVYQEADGEAEDAAIHFPDLFVAHRYRVIQFIFLICDAHWSLLIIHGNADDLQPPSAILLLSSNKARNFGETRCAPRRPKVQQNHFAAIVRQIHPSMVQIHSRKIGRSPDWGWRFSLCSKIGRGE
jgi:hypothetical protein